MTAEEMIQKFHNERIAFAFVHDTFITIPQGSDHTVLMNEPYNLSEEKFEKTIRGYCLDHAIVLYQGREFHKIHYYDKSRNLFETLFRYLAGICKPGEYTIFNGVHIGNPGEIWTPAEALMRISINRKMETEITQRYSFDGEI